MQEEPVNRTTRARTENLSRPSQSRAEEGGIGLPTAQQSAEEPFANATLRKPRPLPTTPSKSGRSGSSARTPPPLPTTPKPKLTSRIPTISTTVYTQASPSPDATNWESMFAPSAPPLTPEEEEQMKNEQVNTAGLQVSPIPPHSQQEQKHLAVVPPPVPTAPKPPIPTQRRRHKKAGMASGEGTAQSKQNQRLSVDVTELRRARSNPTTPRLASSGENCYPVSTPSTPASSSTSSEQQHVLPAADPDQRQEEVKKAPPQQPLSKEDKRALILKELIQTERSYVSDLRLIMEVWMQGFKALSTEAKLEQEDASVPIVQEDIAIVFSNVAQIRSLNEELLTSLEGLEGMPVEQQNLGERLSSFVDFLKMYIQYCGNQALAINRLMELKRANSELKSKLEEMKQIPECNLLDLESFLIKPLQRITKYPLLLKEIIKTTESSHPDYENLHNCQQRLESVVKEINDKKRQSENLVKLIQIQNEFVSSTGEPMKLVSPHRKFIQEGVFKKIKVNKTSVKNAHLFLFNDIMLVAGDHKISLKKKDWGKKFIDRSGFIPIGNVLVWDGNDEEGITFSVVRTDENKSKITIHAASPEEKQTWIEEINSCIVNLPNVVLLGRKDANFGLGAEQFQRVASNNCVSTEPPSPLNKDDGKVL
ncbi:Pleckstrin-like proteiny domain-containing family G member 6 [Balamuthia mandrillaris]